MLFSLFYSCPLRVWSSHNPSFIWNTYYDIIIGKDLNYFLTKNQRVLTWRSHAMKQRYFYYFCGGFIGVVLLLSAILKIAPDDTSKIATANEQKEGEKSTPMISVIESSSVDDHASISKSTKKNIVATPTNNLNYLTIDIPVNTPPSLHRSKNYIYIHSIQQPTTLYIASVDDLDFVSYDLGYEIEDLYASLESDILYIKSQDASNKLLLTYEIPNLVPLHQSTYDDKSVTSLYPLRDTYDVVSYMNDEQRAYIGLRDKKNGVVANLLEVFNNTSTYGSTITNVALSENQRYVSYTVDNKGNYDLYILDLWNNTKELMDSSNHDIKPYFIGSCLSYFNTASDNYTIFDLERHAKGFTPITNIEEALPLNKRLLVVNKNEDGDFLLATYKMFLPTNSLRNEEMKKMDLSSTPPEQIKYDTVIRNANIMDPSTGRTFLKHDIGIIEGKIKTISQETLEGSRIIQAQGLLVTSTSTVYNTKEATNETESKLASKGISTAITLIDTPKYYNRYLKDPYQPRTAVNRDYVITLACLLKLLEIESVDSLTDPQLEQLATLANKSVELGVNGLFIDFADPFMQKEYYYKLALSLAQQLDKPLYFYGFSPDVNNMVLIDYILSTAKMVSVPIYIIGLSSIGNKALESDLLEKATLSLEQDGSNLIWIDTDLDMKPFDFQYVPLRQRDCLRSGDQANLIIIDPFREQPSTKPHLVMINGDIIE